jgi:hypothetical protein
VEKCIAGVYRRIASGRWGVWVSGAYGCDELDGDGYVISVEMR